MYIVTRHENNGWQLVVFNYLKCQPKEEMELLRSISHSAQKLTCQCVFLIPYKYIYNAQDKHDCKLRRFLAPLTKDYTLCLKVSLEVNNLAHNGV